MTPMLPFLQAMTYADSAYPSGRYTLSHGLEGLVQAHRIRGAEQVRSALVDHLRYTAAPGDGVATACAALLAGAVSEPVSGTVAGAAGADHTANISTLITIDHELSATKVTHELRRASSRVGRQMLDVTAQVEERLGREKPILLRIYAQAVAEKETPANQAVVAGLIHGSHAMTPVEAVATELTGLAVGWAGAALRLRQCDHIDSQVIITAAHRHIAELSEHCMVVAEELVSSGQWQLLGRASPGSDLASAAHETASARLFMS